MLKSVNPSYKITAKSRWRYWLWRNARDALQLVFNLGPKNAVCLYLPGPENLDLTVARRYGFHDYNLIAVDHDKKIVTDLRKKKKVNVIHSDLIELVSNWPDDFEVNFINADFKGCIGPKIKRFIKILMQEKAFKRCVVSINVLGAREKGHARDLVMLAKKYQTDNGREFALQTMLQGCMLEVLESKKVIHTPASVAEIVAKTCIPVFSHYQSKSPMTTMAYVNFNLHNYFKGRRIDKRNKKQSFKIAAARAVRTKRLTQQKKG